MSNMSNTFNMPNTASRTCVRSKHPKVTVAPAAVPVVAPMPAVPFNEGSACTVIDLAPVFAKNNIEVTASPVINNTGYTSRGKRKATPCDPIRDPEDLQKLITYFRTHGQAFPRKRNPAMIILGVSVGVRCADLLRLTIRDVLNPDYTVKSEINIFESKTRKTIRPILNNEAKQALANYINSRGNFRFTDCLFPARASAPNEPLDPRAFYMIMRRANDELNLPYHLGAHTLRKTFAYWTIQLHKDNHNVMNALQDMLNHDSMRTTLRYAGITKDDLSVMYNDMSQLFHPENIPLAIRQNSARTNDIYKALSLDALDEEE